MGIIAFVILGLLAGVIAKALLPGSDPGGFIITALIGVVGAVIGGFLAGVLFDADPLDEFFDISTWLTAIAGSCCSCSSIASWSTEGTGTRSDDDGCAHAGAPPSYRSATCFPLCAERELGPTRREPALAASCSGSATRTRAGRRRGIETLGDPEPRRLDEPGKHRTSLIGTASPTVRREVASDEREPLRFSGFATDGL